MSTPDDATKVYAEQRAQQFMGMPQIHVPAGARAYRDNMFRRHGACAEMALYAFAAYAHVVEGYPFKNTLHYPTTAEIDIIKGLMAEASGG